MTRARAIHTTAAVTANAHARARMESPRVAIARLLWSTMARRAAKNLTCASQTTAAVTPSAHARARMESPRVAIARLLWSTMARRAAKNLTCASQTTAAVTPSANARPQTEKLRVAIARLAITITARRAVDKTRARETTAAATPSAGARAREHKLGAASARVATTTTARRAVKGCALDRLVASTTVQQPTGLAWVAGTPTVVATQALQDAIAVTCTRSFADLSGEISPMVARQGLRNAPLQDLLETRAVQKFEQTIEVQRWPYLGIDFPLIRIDSMTLGY